MRRICGHTRTRAVGSWDGQTYRWAGYNISVRPWRIRWVGRGVSLRGACWRLFIYSRIIILRPHRRDCSSRGRVTLPGAAYAAPRRQCLHIWCPHSGGDQVPCFICCTYKVLPEAQEIFDTISTQQLSSTKKPVPVEKFQILKWIRSCRVIRVNMRSPSLFYPLSGTVTSNSHTFRETKQGTAH